ncbi:prolyl oligopeptidase family serine peptidase [Siphonobacter curvatus]|uniref:prolyl oligopeptidase n=1 Tax=Siphonobacter curvatus TaxID=2094562 RepID=A0A2S7IHK9_9BACT|nr:prolyl oligopeptidase family serine peptidase [Siphonobacter curvatus]PQA55568.1 S9 family peptidase [Siphonobacter curvatus]
MIHYPETRQDFSVTDDYFGTTVADPYRWLENDTAPETLAWVAEQNKVTFQYLEQIPFRDRIKKRLEKLWNYPRYGSPFRVGDYYFFSKNDGLQNQAVVYYQKGLAAEPEVFLDPNTWSSDGTVTANFAGFSHDHRYAALSINRAGSDWQEMEVMEISTREKTSDVLRWLKFSGAAWHKNGFYYSRYDEPKPGEELSAANQFHKVYYHQLGTPQEEDQLVFEDQEHPYRYFFAQTTEDERFLILNSSEGTDGSEIWVKDLQQEGSAFIRLYKGFQYNYAVVDNRGDQLLVHTNENASNYHLVLIHPFTREESIFVAEKPEKLESAGTSGGKLFVNYLKDVTDQVFQYDLATGQLDRQVRLPGLGSSYGWSGNKDDQELFYTFTSFLYPPTIFRYTIATGESLLFRSSEIQFNPEDYETNQVFYPSKDGTLVPMFLTHKKGLIRDGSAPTLLYAYGGFNISLSPAFSTSNLILLENGGIYAQVNLRGGGEYGESWHKAGMLENKQNVFDDFIAAAEYLQRQQYTRPERLAIAGGSNGGLLVGAVMTQRPELFRVALPAVGVLDMLRFHLFTVGWGWVVEYGSSAQSKESFENLYGYSPLHQLKAGTSYPATMITTADHDDRVVPAHSFKFAAALQEKHAGPNPVLIRIDTSAGHGAGKPTAKIIEEQADKWAFVFWNMGLEIY